MRLTKEHILSEIARTASANGGIPLGRARFFQETGIKDSDWQGRYWSRWSDAVKETGLTPNRRQDAFPPEMILAQLAALCRELGRFPTSAEMRLRKRSHAEFPNEKVFDRFGSRDALAEALANFCRQQTQFADIEPVCERYLARGAHSPSAPSCSPEKPADEIGFVYLLKSGRYYKIGRSNAVGRRERELAIQLPEVSSVIHSVRTDDPAGIEDYWHRRFADRRKNGEWFQLTSDDVAAFRRRKFM